LSPTVPWLYLPVLSAEAEDREPRGSLLRAYLREWRGPQFSAKHVENRYAGKVIK